MTTHTANKTFLKFDNPNTGTLGWVNLALVRIVVKIDNGWELYFDTNHKATITGDNHSLLEALETLEM